MKQKEILSSLAALFTIILWGITFVSTRELLNDFSPLEILVIRFLLGWLALCLVWKEKLPMFNGRHEIIFALAGLTGVTLYFLLENIALTYTYASNVSVIVTTAPFFTVLLAWKFLHAPTPCLNFFIGFLLAITGIAMLSFNGREVHINPLGDILALAAAATWAIYSILTRKLAEAGYASLPATRRIFFYGLLFMLPCTLTDNFLSQPALLLKWINLGNMLFLGLGASALCFVIWTWCLKCLGAGRASLYIYLVPVVTIIAAAIVLDEKLTPLAIGGVLLTITGLLVSEISGEWFAKLIKGWRN